MPLRPDLPEHRQRNLFYPSGLRQEPLQPRHRPHAGLRPALNTSARPTARKCRQGSRGGDQASQMRMLLVKRPSRLDRATTKALSRIATVAVDSRMSASAFGLNSRTRRTSLTSNLPRTARQTSLPSYILRNNGDSFTASQVLAPPLTIEKTLALPNLTAYAERLLGCA
jgi:hypothetical protein